jgi:hypothetical protein
VKNIFREDKTTNFRENGEIIEIIMGLGELELYGIMKNIGMYAHGVWV